MANGLAPTAEIAVGDAVIPGRKLPPGPGRSRDDVRAHQLARIHRATIEAVAENGYKKLTVRDVVQRAKVSTRTFYEHFESKEDCVLFAYDLVVRRTAQRIVAAQAGERDWQERLRLAFDAFTREVAADPEAARFALIEIHTTGTVALERIRRVEQVYEAMVAESFSRAPDGIAVPQSVIEGIVAGVEHVARAMVLAGREFEVPALSDSLTGWALCYWSEGTLAFADLDRRSTPGGLNTGISPVPSSNAEREDAGARSPMGDRAVLLSSVVRLAAAEGYQGLTVGRICSLAGISSRSFDRHFESVEDCFLAGLEEQARRVIARARGPQGGSSRWANDVYQVIADLCAQISANPALARLLLVEASTTGASGSFCGVRLLTYAAQRIGEGAPSSNDPGEVAIIASTGAAWGLLGRCVAEGRAAQAHRYVPTFAYLILAPVIGTEEAVAAIQAETTTSNDQRPSQPSSKEQE